MELFYFSFRIPSSATTMFLFFLLFIPVLAFSSSPTEQNHDDIMEYYNPAAEYFQLVHHTEVNASVIGVDFAAIVDGVTVEFKHGIQNGVSDVFHGNMLMLDCLQTLFHNYSVWISNKSKRNVCGITFDPKTV